MFYPETHERPTGERENKRHDSDEQVFPQPREDECFAMSGFAERAVGENPSGVEPDREPERGGPESGVGQDAADREKRQESSREEHRIAELAEGMCDRIAPGIPAHGIVRCSRLRWFQEMHN